MFLRCFVVCSSRQRNPFAQSSYSLSKAMRETEISSESRISNRLNPDRKVKAKTSVCTNTDFAALLDIAFSCTLPFAYRRWYSCRVNQQYHTHHQQHIYQSIAPVGPEASRHITAVNSSNINAYFGRPTKCFAHCVPCVHVQRCGKTCVSLPPSGKPFEQRSWLMMLGEYYANVVKCV